MCVCDGETNGKRKVSCQKNFYIDVISLGKKMQKCRSVALHFYNILVGGDFNCI